MAEGNFADRVIEKVRRKQSHAVVGLDPVLNRIPPYLVKEAAAQHGQTAKGAAAAYLAFNRLVIDAVADQAPAVKPQSAFYEAYGHHGWEAFWETIKYARSRGLAVIADAKRGDIGSTAEAYAAAFFGHSNPVDSWEDPEQWADSLTVNPYLGSDGIEPFVSRCAARGTGLFVLVKTSNPSSGELQDQELFSGEDLALQVAKLVDQLGLRALGSEGYSAVGAVVGATYPEDLARFRSHMEKAIFLVPGYGAQGGNGDDVAAAFNPDGLGALVAASRSVIYAYQKEDPDPSPVRVRRAISEALTAMNADINSALARAGKLFW